MTDNQHPSYPFPSIREVVCEIHFRLASNWDASLYGQYYNKIREEFPTFEPVSLALLLEVAQQPSEASRFTIPHVIRYKHHSRDLFIQLSENRIAVNVLPIYPGWHQVRSDIEYSWDKLCELVKPTEITRIGLRYINGVERSAEEETLSRWFKAGDYIPQALLQSHRGFEARIATYMNSKNRIVVRLADQPSPVNRFGSFVFDIDRITDQSIAADTNLLLDKASLLHDDVWSVFKSAKSQDLEGLLKGELL